MEDNNSYSHTLDKKLWAGFEGYFFKSLEPRISKGAIQADDGAVQAQIDVFGKPNIGTIAGSLSSAGNFSALLFPDCLPDRLPILAYLSELESLFEAFEMEIVESLCAKDFVDKAKVDRTALMAPKDASFNNDKWQANFKMALEKAKGLLFQTDPELGPKCTEGMRDLVEAPYLASRMQKYSAMDDFLHDRIIDIGWPQIAAAAQFAVRIHITPEERGVLGDIFWPLWAHAAYMHDYHTWDWEVRIATSRRGEVINAVPLLERLHGLSLEAAKDWLKDRCFEFEKEYLRRKAAFLAEHTAASLSDDVRRWFYAQEAVATGFAIWCPLAYRHATPSENKYKEYYANRLKEGAEWFDTCTESQELLPTDRVMAD
ncbi:isoprenoid synthase domain-containing protein [Xylariaceae sp. FL0662B]|nr:isoprenoid synthase domain-containing protein [Xylariaceae sp. FL0662B]